MITANDILDYADEHNLGREKIAERLIEYQRGLFGQYDRDELLEVLMDWCINGVTGYEEYDDDDYLKDLTALIESDGGENFPSLQEFFA